MTTTKPVLTPTSSNSYQIRFPGSDRVVTVIHFTDPDDRFVVRCDDEYIRIDVTSREAAFEAAWCIALDVPATLSQKTLDRIAVKAGVCARGESIDAETFVEETSALPTKEYAAVLRNVLRARLDGSISVRKNTGTASSWVHARPRDNATTEQRARFARLFFNGMVYRCEAVAHPSYGYNKCNYDTIMARALGVPSHWRDGTTTA